MFQFLVYTLTYLCYRMQTRNLQGEREEEKERERTRDLILQHAHLPLQIGGASATLGSNQLILEARVFF